MSRFNGVETELIQVRLTLVNSRSQNQILALKQTTLNAETRNEAHCRQRSRPCRT